MNVICSIYLVEVSYMFKLYMVISGLATREKIRTQFPKGLRSQCTVYVLYIVQCIHL